ncbi:sigma-70 family RNA polymerase sigma factor [Paludisphaera mucosa]|uniref:Sigma-70 family RNA polymerase sigma factor n=1 Tax=Paludisphaera mucosa TaxID=3030827 RepID=A0ABT6FKP9_9BACT|nr:sigma-70 family RNA polymerase sigma factor [Paludisphaera mucosa]MDG3008152.1 sigma-70 family RNA polymerase sigma factor [Paludisphaera mucosa]
MSRGLEGGSDADSGWGSTGPESLVAVLTGLRRKARGLLVAGGSLGPSDLVGEAAVRLLRDARVRRHPDPRYVYRAGVRAMRRILIDRFRARMRHKRGGALRRVPLDAAAEAVDCARRGAEAHDLSEAVARLGAFAARQAEAVRLCYFERMTAAEAAAKLGLSKRAVEQDLSYARAWLRRELSGGS